MSTYSTGFIIEGGFAVSFKTISASIYEVLPSDFTIKCNTYKSDITLSLPSPKYNPGRIFVIIKQSSKNSIIIKDLNLKLTKDRESVILQSLGSGWYIIGRN
jgi:hypothetical protein